RRCTISRFSDQSFLLADCSSLARRRSCRRRPIWTWSVGFLLVAMDLMIRNAIRFYTTNKNVAMIHLTKSRPTRRFLFSSEEPQHMKQKNTVASLPKAPTATMTIEDAARELGISRHTAYQCAKEGQLPTI